MSIPDQPSPLKRFMGDDNEDLVTYYANYAFTLHLAQLLERNLQLVANEAERQGLLTIDKTALGVRDDADLPPKHVIRLLERQGYIDHDVSRLLRRAISYRNELAHAFFLDNFTDALNAAGRASLNDRLRGIYRIISIAYNGVAAARDSLYAHYGFDDLWRAKIKELREQITDIDIPFLDEADDS